MFEPSMELTVLKAFFQNMPQGAYVLYSDIEKHTKVKMDTRGKQLMRSALRSLHVEYRAERGQGIEIEGVKNAMHIVTGRVKRVSKAITRADKTTAHMTKYLDQLPPPDRDRLLATASVFGAVKTLAKGLTNIYKPKTLNVLNLDDTKKSINGLDKLFK
jgi:hypothetical protein